jgi:hypothetical protein
MALEHCLGLSHQAFGFGNASAQCLLACFDLARLLLTTFRTLLPVRHWSQNGLSANQFRALRRMSVNNWEPEDVFAVRYDRGDLCVLDRGQIDPSAPKD